MRVLSILITMALLTGCGAPLSNTTTKPTASLSTASKDCQVSFNGDINAPSMGLLLDELESRTRGCEQMGLVLNSPGGELEAGNAVLPHLAELPLVTHADGIVASMAVPLYLMGDYRTIDAEATLYLHNIVWMFPGAVTMDARLMRDMADQLVDDDRQYSQVVAKATGLSPAAVLALMEGDTTLSAQEAVELGFAHEIVE